MALEAELAEKNEALKEAETSYVVITKQFEQTKIELSSTHSENALLETRNEELIGQLTRLQKEHDVEVQTLQAENKDLSKHRDTECA